jgi:hypothetical protein
VIRSTGLSLFGAVHNDCTPLNLIYLCAPPPPPIPVFVGVVTHEKTLLYFHIVDLYIRIYLYSVYNILLFLNILFRYSTLFADADRRIL